MANPWTRIKHSAISGAHQTNTATFDEPAPLDDSHLIVAVVSVGRTGGVSDAPAISWTGATLVWSAHNTITWTGVYTLRGDGSTNTLTCDWTGQTLVRSFITLYGFAGYVSQSAHTATYDASNQTSGTSATCVSDVATTESPTVALALITLSNFSSMGVFDSDFANAPQIGSHAAHSAVKLLTSTGIAPSTSITWTTGRTYRRAMFTFRLAPASTADDIGVRIGGTVAQARYLGTSPVTARYRGEELLWEQ